MASAQNYYYGLTWVGVVCFVAPFLQVQARVLAQNFEQAWAFAAVTLPAVQPALAGPGLALQAAPPFFLPASGYKFLTVCVLYKAENRPASSMNNSWAQF